MPDIAKKAGAKVIATGRSDFPNQVNNALAFPGVFRPFADSRRPGPGKPAPPARPDVVGAGANPADAQPSCGANWCYCESDELLGVNV